jgi:hypothetical protein
VSWANEKREGRRGEGGECKGLVMQKMCTIQEH